MRRKNRERFFGKLIFSAIMMVVARILEPVPVLRTVFDIVIMAA